VLLQSEAIVLEAYSTILVFVRTRLAQFTQEKTSSSTRYDKLRQKIPEKGGGIREKTHDIDEV
jgi:hypothetical protein